MSAPPGPRVVSPRKCSGGVEMRRFRAPVRPLENCLKWSFLASSEALRLRDLSHFLCYPCSSMPDLIHENLPGAIQSLSARIIAIRDSL